MDPDRYRHEEDKKRAQAWYAILGLTALVAGAWAVLRWIPDNPFNVPSELPGTSRYNADQLTGAGGPMLAAPPSAAGAVGAGCRLGDVALVQNFRGALRQTPTETLLARAASARARGRRFSVAGWSARGADPSPDGGDTPGCEVTFTWRDDRGEHRAVWSVSPDRRSVTPVNPEARDISNAPPGHGR